MPIADVPTPPGPAATSLRAAVLQQIPAAWYRPDRRIYWFDLLLSAGIGWGAFAGVLMLDGAARAVSAGVATLALYRATMFIHELTHVNARELPGFSLAWHVLVAVPLLVPFFLYDGVHVDHHRPRVYGTRADPEYVPFGHRPPWVMTLFGLAASLFPVAMVFRFGVLAPLSWACPPFRRALVARGSSLVINHAYTRQRPLGRSGVVQEIACAVFCWCGAVAWLTGAVGTRVVLAWALVGGAAATINAVRVLGAHRYASDGQEVTTLGQLMDSTTLIAKPERGLRAAAELLVAPMGLRYHALHHWIPALPYHTLGHAHRYLVALADADPYRGTMSSLPAAVRDLVARARRTTSATGSGQGPVRK